MPSPELISRRSARALALQGVMLATLPGCTSAGAPDIELLGAYIPAWMICAVVGILGGVLARILFVVTHVAELLPYQLTVCTGIGIMVALGTWLLFFR
jgi:hypothetical protein